MSPADDWLTDMCWLNIVNLGNRLPVFRDLPDSIFRSEAIWRQWYDHEAPEIAEIPVRMPHHAPTSINRCANACRSPICMHRHALTSTHVLVCIHRHTRSSMYMLVRTCRRTRTRWQEFEGKLNKFGRLLVVRSLRDDRTILAATEYIADTLGTKYIESKDLLPSLL